MQKVIYQKCQCRACISLLRTQRQWRQTLLPMHSPSDIISALMLAYVREFLAPLKADSLKHTAGSKNLFVGETKPLITYTIYILNMKEFLKNITPPIVWNVVRSLFLKKKLHPIWNTLDYDPLKGIKLFLDPSGAWQKKMIDGSYDQFLFDRIKGKDLRGKVIYDIGAHIGYHSLYFARLVGSGGRVRSFEPSPKTLSVFGLSSIKMRDLRTSFLFSRRRSQTASG